MKILIAILLVCLSMQVAALEVEGVKLDDKVQLGNVTLQLNGAGLRTKFFFDIYVAALYLPKREASAEAVIADQHEHRMALYILHSLSSKKLYGAFTEAIEANHSQAEMAALDAQLKQMEQIFNSVDGVKPGDVIALDFLPVSGTQISINGIVRGTIAGAEFNRALLKIWLGNKPVQEDIKKGLLGG